MTDYVVSTNIVDTTSSQLYGLRASDTLTIRSGASLVQTGVATAANVAMISQTGSGDATITNDGYVSSANNAVFANDNECRLTLNNNGYLRGGNGAYPTYSAAVHVEEGFATISNTGVIVNDTGHAIVHAATASSLTDEEMTVTNRGLIASYAGTFAIVTTYTASLNVTNFGAIFGGIGFDKYLPSSPGFFQAALILTNAAGGSIIGGVSRLVGGEPLANSTIGYTTDSVVNAGTITGAVTLGLGVDTMTNTGTVIGDVNLGVADDSYSAAGSNGQVTGRIIGGLGNDSITGGFARDVIYGDNPTGDTTGGVDTLMGGFGDDVIYGGYGTDVLYGNQDNDVLYGNQDNDVLYGGQGNDTLYGGQGDDVIFGNAGADVLYGNIGVDRFVYTTRNDSLNSARDRIQDFVGGQDKLDLRAVRTGPNDTYQFESLNGGPTLVSVDLGGDGTFDMAIEVSGSIFFSDVVWA